ncbi:nucleotidyltransferase family protein [Pseudorhodobacter sp.]|uniref:nucleotidyltransferase family protein n=1 Tax=Pseudorhodobacter sp. TaxID=1934400 RepID=UPI0026471111|nr:nucleotidyltransferase family protein [Pseudorhodobacter sp.]MDN5787138.1 nucleotidyltransferase family protein [Pseudorhodobacter sp.]
MQNDSAIALSILLLGAGQSRRMRGPDKLLETIGKTSLLRHISQIALGTGLPVLVTLPPDRPARRVAISGLPLRLVEVADAALGLAASIRAGIAAAPPGAVLILLADMPEIDQTDLEQFVTAHRATPRMILQGCTMAGVAGHPVLFPAWLRPALLGLHGDRGAKSLLQEHASVLRNVPLPDHHAITDLDSPEDWARWRAGQKP